MAHWPAPSRNCSEYRTMLLGLCSRHRGDPTPSLYCTSCIGCQSSSGSHTSLQFWHVHENQSTSILVYLHSHIMEHVCSWTLCSSAIHCWSNHSTGLSTFPSMLSDFQYHLSGTCRHTVLISDSLAVFKPRLFYSLRLSLNLWSDLLPAPLKLRPYTAI